MRLLHYIISIAMLVLLSPGVLAETEVISASRGVTCNGAYGVLVPLGFEQYMPLATSLMFYRWLAIALLFFAMAMASQRNMRFFVVIIPLMAALFAYFGWLNDASNPTRMWALIIATGMISAGIYMKDTNKEKWGSGGPGLTLLNFVFMMILLQGCVGLVNTTGIWQENLAATPSQYQNVDLESQLTGISNTGGFLDGAISTAVALLIMGISLLKMIVSIILTIAAFSVTLYLIYPFLYGNVIVASIIGVTQVIVWLLYAWFFFTIVFKPMPDGGYI